VTDHSLDEYLRVLRTVTATSSTPDSQTLVRELPRVDVAKLLRDAVQPTPRNRAERRAR
jgi:hypothetical protein